MTGSIGKPEIHEVPLSSRFFRKKIEDFLQANGLRLEDVDYYCVIQDAEDRILAGGGLLGDVIKCVAVSDDARGEGLSIPLVSHLISLASQRGYTDLKLFTKPSNRSIFEEFGFRLLAEVPEAIFMENGHGLEDYLRSLRLATPAPDPVEGPVGSTSSPTVSSPVPEPSPAVPEPSPAVPEPVEGVEGTIPVEPCWRPRTSGIIIMNANPFTLGHRYLVEQASKAVDTLYVIPVMEGDTLFPYEERREMIRSGCGDLAVVLDGSPYQISSATFPTYFLKDLSAASETQMRLDLDLLVRHIAPALGVSVRFVGSEPSDPLTARYNALIKEILPAHGIDVVEIPRSLVPVPPASELLAAVPEPVEGRFLSSVEGTVGATFSPTVSTPVSASLVRKALNEGSFRKAAALTPPTTWPYLVAELMARALRMELDTPLKPGLVGPDGSGAHSDMDYDLMKDSIDVIRRSFIRHLIEGRNLEVIENQLNKQKGVSQNGLVSLLNRLIINNLKKTALEENLGDGGNAEVVPLDGEGNDEAVPLGQDIDADLHAFGRAIEADMLAFTGGVNTHRGAIFSLGLIALAFLKLNLLPEQCVGESDETESQSRHCNVKSSKVASRPLRIINIDYQSIKQYRPCENERSKSSKSLNIKPYSSPALLSGTIAALAAGIQPSPDSNGMRAVTEYGVKGALQMAREGYKPLFEDWLPCYRSLKISWGLEKSVVVEDSGHEGGKSNVVEGHAVGDLSLHMTLLRIMFALDDTCIVHRVGYDRAQEVKKEAGRVLEAVERTVQDAIRKIGPEAGLSGPEAVRETGLEALGKTGLASVGKTGLEAVRKTALESLREFKRLCDAEGISPGGAADMLAATIFIDSLIN